MRTITELRTAFFSTVISQESVGQVLQRAYEEQIAPSPGFPTVSQSAKDEAKREYDVSIGEASRLLPTPLTLRAFLSACDVEMPELVCDMVHHAKCAALHDFLKACSSEEVALLGHSTLVAEVTYLEEEIQQHTSLLDEARSGRRNVIYAQNFCEEWLHETE